MLCRPDSALARDSIVSAFAPGSISSASSLQSPPSTGNNISYGSELSW